MARHKKKHGVEHTDGSINEEIKETMDMIGLPDDLPDICDPENPIIVHESKGDQIKSERFSIDDEFDIVCENEAAAKKISDEEIKFYKGSLIKPRILCDEKTGLIFDDGSRRVYRITLPVDEMKTKKISDEEIKPNFYKDPLGKPWIPLIVEANLTPIAIYKAEVRFRVEEKEGAAIDIHHIIINRNAFSNDPDFSLGFINTDLNVKPINPNEEAMLTKVQKEARENMKAKQKEFKDMLNLKLLIIRA